MTWARSDHDDEQARLTGGIFVCAGGELRLRKRRQSVRCRNNTKENQGLKKGTGGARGQMYTCPPSIMKLEPIIQIREELMSSRFFFLVGLAEKKPPIIIFLFAPYYEGYM